MRRLFCILLLICLPLQGFAAQIASVRLAGAHAAAHHVAHAADLHHHHHDDGAVHYDDSDESIEHSHEHSAAAQQLLPSLAPMLFFPVAVTRAEPDEPASFIPDPDLDDPQRPPAWAPGLAAGG